MFLDKRSCSSAVLRFQHWRTGRALHAFRRASAGERRAFDAWLARATAEARR